MKILVTGASGLLGLNLALEASKAGHAVVGLVNHNGLPAKHPAFYPTPLTVLQADLLADGSIPQLLEKAQPDWIIHCAALANVDACEKAPELAQRLNAEIPGELARYVGRGGARLLHISTDAVFDGVRGEYTEEDAANPLSVYAHTKLAGEQAVLAANPQAIVTRVNLFGWSRSGQRSLAEFFFNNLSAGKGVRGFEDVFFAPLLANDLAGLLLQMLQAQLSGLYHAVSPMRLSKYAFGRAIAERFGFDSALVTPVSVQSAGLAAARSPNLTLRVEKLQAALPAQSLPNWQQGLERLYQLHLAGYPQWLKQ